MILIVADAGPLIGISRINRLHLLKQLYGSVLIPQKVFDEITMSGGKPGARAVASAVQAGWIKVIQIKNHSSVSSLKRVLDEGEAEAIQLAVEKNAHLLLMDEKKGRKVAKSRGINVIGTGGILIKSKNTGLLEFVSPILQELKKAGYRLSPALCKKILELAGESED